MRYVLKKAHRKKVNPTIAITTCPFCLQNDEAHVFSWEGKTGKKGLYLRCFACQSRGFGIGITVLLMRREQDGMLTLRVSPEEWQEWKDRIVTVVEEAPRTRNLLHRTDPAKRIALLP